MITLRTKYQKRALLPSLLMEGIHNGDIVETKDGVKVRITYRATYKNVNGWCEDDLDVQAQLLYGKSFGFVEQVWKNRMVTDDWWHLIGMDIVSDDVSDGNTDKRRVYRR